MGKDLYKESSMGDPNAFGADLRICSDCKNFWSKPTDPFCKKLDDMEEINRAIDLGSCVHFAQKPE